MKKLVIIGGGFAGSLAAQKLENDFDVTLIDTKDYFEFTPAVLRAIVNPSYVKKIEVLHSQYLRKAKVVVGEVKNVSSDFVSVKGKKIHFDYLIICSGSKYDRPFKEQNVVVANRANELAESHEKLAKAKSVLIVGGGPVGVELAGEILDEYAGKKITIVHAGKKLMERASEKTIEYVEDYLKKKGVEVFCGEKVVRVNRGFCVTDKGRKLKAELVFLCTGIKPNFSFVKDKKILDERNYIKVNEFLQVQNKKNIFAAGDVTSIAEEKTAQNAERQARIVVKNIFNLESGKELEKYKSKRTPQVISLGQWRGIYDSGSFVFAGILPALLKVAIRWKEMWKRR